MTLHRTIHQTILYEKFLYLEGWAVRGKHLCEVDRIDLAIEAAERMRKDLNELLVLLKAEPDELAEAKSVPDET